MNITFGPKGIVQIDNCRIIYRNFSGEPSQYNRAGERNFSVLIDDEEIAQALINEGWNVKIKPPREEGDTPFMSLPVKVKFNNNSPKVYLKTGNIVNKLDENCISLLDTVDIVNVDMDIRPYNWEVNGKTGRSAYLRSICVTQDVDRFAKQFEMEEGPEELPWKE